MRGFSRTGSEERVSRSDDDTRDDVWAEVAAPWGARLTVEGPGSRSRGVKGQGSGLRREQGVWECVSV